MIPPLPATDGDPGRRSIAVPTLCETARPSRGPARSLYPSHPASSQFSFLLTRHPPTMNQSVPIKRLLGSGKSQFSITFIGDDRCLCPSSACGKRVRQRGLYAHARGHACRGAFTPDQLDALAMVSSTAKARHEKRRRDTLRALHAANPDQTSKEHVVAARAAAALTDGLRPAPKRRPGRRRSRLSTFPAGPVAVAAAAAAAAAAAPPRAVQGSVDSERYQQQMRVADFVTLVTARLLRGETPPPHGADVAERLAAEAMCAVCPPVRLMETAGPWTREEVYGAAAVDAARTSAFAVRAAAPPAASVSAPPAANAAAPPAASVEHRPLQ